MEIKELTDETERREAIPILRQLWSDTDPDDILEWTADDEYHLFGGFIGNKLVSVTGVLVKHVLHHTRHAWLYDLVVDRSYRGNGYGTSLIEFIEQWADERECEYVTLVSAMGKEDVHQFYENNNYEKFGYIIEKQL